MASSKNDKASNCDQTRCDIPDHETIEDAEDDVAVDTKANDNQDQSDEREQEADLSEGPASLQTAEREGRDEASDTDEDHVAHLDESATPESDEASESLSTLLKRLNDGDTGTASKAGAVEAAADDDLQTNAKDLVARARQTLAEADIGEDGQLMALINELNGKLDRTHAVIAKSLPSPSLEQRLAETAAFDTPPPPPTAGEMPKQGRSGKSYLSKGLWGALIAAAATLAYSHSWWLNESPDTAGQKTAQEASEGPRQSQSLHRLGTLSVTSLSDPVPPPAGHATGPELAAKTVVGETRSQPRPTTPDAPAVPEVSAEDAIASAITASSGEEPSAEPASPPASGVRGGVAEASKPAGPTESAPAATTPRESLKSARNSTAADGAPAVSEWRRMAARSMPEAPAGDRRRPVANVPSFKVAPIGGAAGEPISLPITLPALARETEASFMISGLPEGSVLSAGERAGAATWILSVAQLKDLTLTVPVDAEAGKIPLEVTMVTSDGRMPRTEMVALSLKPAPVVAPIAAPVIAPTPEPARTVAIAPPPSRTVAPAPTVTAAAKPEPAPALTAGKANDSKDELLTRGESLMKIGDIAGARLIFELATESGNVKAMVALAKTYDPAYLAGLGVRGIRPDVAKAIAWYRRASAQGHMPSGDRAEALVAMARR